MHTPFDLIVIGAGAAGLFCASIAGQRGLRVALLDHSPRLAEKIRISGGGRCNFTNVDADRPERYLSENPRFARPALRAFAPPRFLDLLRRHGVAFHEKHKGQLFCDGSSTQIIELLRAECDAGSVRWYRPCRVDSVVRRDSPVRFELATDAGLLHAATLIVATGGLSIPKIGATDFGYRLARQFGLRVVEPRPALVPLLFGAEERADFAELSGVSLPVTVRAPQAADAPAFDEDLLFTHRGLSGPAALQISTYWKPGTAISVDLAPHCDLAAELIGARAAGRRHLSAALGQRLPRRLAVRWLERQAVLGAARSAVSTRPLAEMGNREIVSFAAGLRDWRIEPSGTEGFAKAEVTAGGVATDALDPQTMQALAVPGLFFIGEVVDVTGWLGGYNFQWAWASAFLAAQAIEAKR